MKKVPGAIIAASAVAAVAIAGTVSFAAWTGGGSTSAEVTGSTGSITAVGEVTVAPSATSGTGTSKDSITMNTLLPYDFLGEPTENSVLYWEFTVTLKNSSSFTLEGSIKNGEENAVGADLFYSTTAPTVYNPTTNTMPSASGIDIKTAQTITPSNGTQATVYVYMVAYSTDAMNANISLTFTAT